MKKHLWVLLVLLTGTVAATAQTFTLGNLTYNVLNQMGKTVEVKAATPGITTATVPATVEHDGSTYTVVSIAYMGFQDCRELASVTLPGTLEQVTSNAFARCEALTSITIPQSVNSIGQYAFYGCTNLASVSLPDGLQSIPDYAFKGCHSLASVELPGNLTSLRQSAFEDCTSLTHINLPGNLVTIGVKSFLGCTSLESINIPASVSDLRNGAFGLCSSLVTITVDAGNYLYFVQDGILYKQESGIMTILRAQANIGDNFRIPESVYAIDNYAFSSCTQLTSITFPETLGFVRFNAFESCHNLATVNINLSTTGIAENVFGKCPLLESFNVAADNRVWKENDGVLYKRAGNVLYRYPAAKMASTFEVPEGVERIAEGAFSESANITSVSLPNSVTVIGREAFRNCPFLSKVYLPESLTTLGSYAFEYCFSLSQIYSFAKVPPAVSAYSLAEIHSDNVTLFVPAESMDAYRADAGWNLIPSIKAIEAGVADDLADDDAPLRVYDLRGIPQGVNTRSGLQTLPAGIYIVNGRQTLVR